MDDEAAFIETIRLQPDNDIPRLIYADWLEERGDPRAEYLRLTARIAELERLDESTTGCDVQLHQLSKQIDPNWREAVGRRYDVILLTGSSYGAVGVIKTIRELTAKGLKDAKDMYEAIPSTIQLGLLREDAVMARAKLESGQIRGMLFRPAPGDRICDVALRFSETK